MSAISDKDLLELRIELRDYKQCRQDLLFKVDGLEAENERLKKSADEAELVIMEYSIQEGTTAGARDWLKKYRGWVEKELQK